MSRPLGWVFALLSVLVLAACSQSSPPAMHTLSLDGSHGRVSVDGTPHTLPYHQSFPDGADVTLAALPDSGYHFGPWSGDLSGGANPTTLTMNADKRVSATFTATAPADTRPPSVSLTGPSDGATVASSTVTVTGTASDNVGVQRVQARLNGGAWQSCSGLSTFQCSVGPLSQGANTVAVVATDAAGNQGSATIALTYATTSTSDPFNITLDIESSLTTAELAAFQDAAARWSQIITQGLPDLNVTIPQGACGGLPTSTFSGVIDDLRIAVQAVTIDGPGGILGQGGPCRVRSSDGLPAFGIMQFDSADLAMLQQQGLLQATILHEMGHVLGFGTVWGSLLSGAGTTNPRFIGAHAEQAWQALGGSGGVPVENCLDASGNPMTNCGPGTEDAHWREAIFGNELMTGYLNAGTNPLSRLTIASFADLGYTVDENAADAYSLPAGVTPQSLASATHLHFQLIRPSGSLP
ncbi:MAG: leishmanolysin-related zinc metalloendopeptidase [Deinococcales bacterium]